jgi:hypothetical protein
MLKTFCIAVVLAVLSSLAAQAQKANLSGTWRLNVAKSFMGQEHPFSNYEFTRKIQQSGESISIAETGIHNSVVNVPLPDSNTAMQVTADGNEHEVHMSTGNPSQPESVLHVTATWQAGTLELVQIVLGLANMTKHRLFLSDDGSQLIDLVEGHNIYGDSEQRLVFDKLL